MRFSLFKQKKEPQLYTVAFYNLENLFDTVDDEKTLDDDFTPTGYKKWTKKRYHKKLFKLAKVISKIGYESANTPPVLVGIAEVENEEVIKDLLYTEPLRDIDYGYVHYDSPDERGIDTGLLYLKSNFEVIHSEPVTLLIHNLKGVRDTTRDILYVKGILNGEVVHLFVNHWPSRRDGSSETDYKRVEAAKTVRKVMTEIEEAEVDPNYIIMGDFNDNPSSESIQTLIKDTNLYNPMEKLHTPSHKGSTNYKKSWSLFDQIMVSHNFFNYEKGTHSFAHANIFDDTFLTEFKGKYKGSPYRTYAGSKYLGGYSDHFPVYIQLKLNS
ncbi:endonuclease [uncultured Maribacter sp.]|uniref:endonuclease/exonuclease/phosphatase family protein n=1 Tax=uncultured Maribacter sp. TaxID=431308 RepID=UPI002624C8AE|nr:endonuclease [uncultured Maribacter sp.]